MIFPQTNYISINATDFRNVIISKIVQKIKGKKVIINGAGHIPGLEFYLSHSVALETKFEFYDALSKLLTKKNLGELWYIYYRLAKMGNKIYFAAKYDKIKI